jgi:hypothetical protein
MRRSGVQVHPVDPADLDVDAQGRGLRIGGLGDDPVLAFRFIGLALQERQVRPVPGVQGLDVDDGLVLDPPGPDARIAGERRASGSRRSSRQAPSAAPPNTRQW